jgi:3-dehydroquinate synthase/2-deoxy-scyllo-inosose synthase
LKYINTIAPFRICVISDTTVADLYENSLRDLLSSLKIKSDQYWYKILPGEASKTLKVVNDVLEEILPHMTRDSLIIAFGGGVVGNLAGTVAALLFRGCQFIHLPTAFMAQADSAIGIKQAVNASFAKNAFGAYHTPLAVFNDIRFLDTLPVSQWRNGLAESIKVGVTRSPEFAKELKNLIPKLSHFSDEDIFYLLEETIYPKLIGLSDDPHEKNSLLYLEIGHTLGHAIERASKGTILHGTAIALGMIIETKIGMMLGISSDSVYECLTELFNLLFFPNRIPPDISTQDIMQCLLCDNRRIATGPVFVFATTLGRTCTNSKIDLNLVREVLDEYRSG